MKRWTLMELAKQAVEITERGAYTADCGRAVDIAAAIRNCLAATRLFTPSDLNRLREEVLAKPARPFAGTIEVVNETTLTGVARLLADSADPLAALNFASAKNPGGGFLSGGQGQEESLARSSALHASLLQASEFYERHRASPSLLYSDAVILSPGCPVFRNDDGVLLSKPHPVTFITSAAPNAVAAAKNRPDELPAIPEIFRRRSEYVLAVAAAHGYKRLVLGAWGCGVFGNDPAVVAAAFAGHLRGVWAGRFERIVFSVHDTSASRSTFEAFRSALAPDARGEIAR
ncbi:MAG: TIGR02452 family protein [Thermogutta sp.]